MTLRDQTSSHGAPTTEGAPAFDTYTLFCHDLPTKAAPELGVILVTGASGYIGGRLVPELIARGYRVRVMVRGQAEVYRRRWPEVEVVTGDALDPASLRAALQGVYAAYYLIHSLNLGPAEFAAADRTAARYFREAAREQGVSRILYLGGLGEKVSTRSPHLRNRMEVAEELQAGPVPVTILRAAIIIGSGSASYEIIRHLVTRSPLLLIPHWARNLCQPAAIRDVIKYLVGCLETPETTGRFFDIGSDDVLTYEDMLRSFASILGRKILFLPSPLPAMGVFAYVASLLTPVPAAITISLMEGLRDEVVCKDDEIRRLIPFKPLSYREAVARALTREEQDRVYTRWSDAYPPRHELAIKLAEVWDKPLYTVSYSLLSNKPAPSLFKSITGIGGKSGWFHNNWMWRLRGAVDRIILGVGTVRGRKRQSILEVNDVVDFWRVEEIEPDARLLLRAEMILPGRAWLEFTLTPVGEQQQLGISAYFQTRSLFGKAYWYFFLPFHELIFNGLIKQIEQRAR